MSNSINLAELPQETKIYYSKGKAILRMALLLVCLAAGIYLLAQPNAKLAGGVVCAVTILVSAINIRIFANNAPQIIVNKDGLETSKAPFYPWSKISNEEVVRRFNGKVNIYYLNYNYPGGQVSVRLNSMACKANELGELLKDYRGQAQPAS
ncbi:hypothetical protein C8P68_106369 [Mucilaginibacter yixingensis]|uniref:PH (Pleckstrin Homology) domain-containing protein n=1 Tax=Mucilaginibacter yixingensis TaxID=1295612 RepID=A0A2T5J7N4_9SPHI|nr:hypothetical protein [Mucilaginibacter yixingensis]PTQ95154.1 hypothetical protein C8P68_106369 [Mucilaginibacter yixingensis]